MQYPARANAGRLQAVSIGIAVSGSEARLYTPLLDTLPSRSPTSHKHTVGSVLVIGGSAAMPGAASLTSRAALRAGAGLVYKACLSTCAHCPEWPEIMLAHCDASEVYTTAWFDELQDYDCVAVGPGLLDIDKTDDFLEHLIKHHQYRLVIDATGLRSLARLLVQQRIQPKQLSQAVITPHAGEAAALLGCSTERIQRDRYTAAALLVEKTGASVILKGAASIIDGVGCVQSVLPYGNPFMATAGSGDVLSGILAARLAARDQSTYEASCTATLIHALAGDACHRRSGGPLIASDLIEDLPQTFGMLYREGFGE